MKVKNETEVAQSCPTLSDPMDCGAGIGNFLTDGKKAPFLICKVRAGPAVVLADLSWEDLWLELGLCCGKGDSAL